MGNYRSRRVEPNEVTVVCYEDHINCDWFCTGFLHFCTKDIQFDSFTACNHQGLIDLVSGESRGSGSEKAKTMFSNINQELKRSNSASCIKKPICWTIPFWILFAAVLGVALFFCNAHKIQCTAGKVCSGGRNSTHAQSLQCTSTSNCIKHQYASPLVTNILFGLSALMFIILTSVMAMSGRYKSNMVNGVLNNCLKDWRFLGIAIEYHAGRHYDDTEEYVPGHLILRLPSAQVVPIPPMYPLTESNRITNGFLYN